MKYILIVFLFLSAIIYSQELNCKVDVNFQSLPVNNRELLVDFAGVIENYMNTTKYTQEDWGERIDCTLNILFLSAGSDIDYSAQIVVVSQRPIFQSTKKSPMLIVNDGQWQFRYQKGQALYPNQTSFDPLTSLLDFYALIIIGMDMDTFGVIGGTPYFKRAQDIVNLGANSNANFGWQSSSAVYSRWGLVNDILSERYSAFRSSIFSYHQFGLDSFTKNGSVAIQNIVYLVDVLWNMYQQTGSINSVYVRTFFDAKHGEMIEYLTSYNDTEIFAKLIKIDPPHTSKYSALIP